MILTELNSSTQVPIVFTNEKLFTVQAAQNNRILSKNIRDVPVGQKSILRRQGPAAVMVWVTVTSDGKKAPLIFIPEGVKVNKDIYLNMMKSDVLSWLQSTYPGAPYLFQQNGAPSHTGKVVQEWSKQNFSRFWDKELWPPSSPDMNPMDFSIWSVLESRACSKNHANVEALKTSLTSHWAKISEDEVRAAFASFKHRVRLIVQAKGGHVERHLL